MTDTEKIEAYKRLAGTLFDALQQYADPGFYHAIAFLADPPAGGFADDFDSNHDDFNGSGGVYDEKPGKLARETLRKVFEDHPDLPIYTELPE